MSYSAEKSGGSATSGGGAGSRGRPARSHLRYGMVAHPSAVYYFTMLSRLTAFAAVVAVSASTAVGAVMSGNPVIPGAADPFAAIFGDRLYVYPTTGNGRFYAYSTHDFGTWRNDGLLLDLANVSWAGGSKNAWAPDMVQRNGTYYLYYSVGGSTSRIGVATSNSPTGHFVDSGQPLVTDTTGGAAANTFEAIDPEVFTDPVSGKTYLYAGGSRGSKLRIWELNSSLTGLANEISVSTPTNFTEGSFVHYRNGRYYLSYSHGSWNNDSYSVHYAISNSPTGPWTYMGQILGSNGEDKGPGHHSFFENPADGKSYIVYHRWENQVGSGPYDVNGASRDTAIDYFTYTSAGFINPITMTNTGVAVSAIPEPAALALGLVALPLMRRRRAGDLR